MKQLSTRSPLRFDLLRRAPIEERKGALAKLLSQPHEGIALNQHYTGDRREHLQVRLRARLRWHSVENNTVLIVG